jgi:hypothetical protein
MDANRAASARGPSQPGAVPLLAADVLRALIFTQAEELGMPQVIVGGPLEELELADEHRLQPLALGHLRLREPRPSKYSVGSESRSWPAIARRLEASYIIEHQ